MTDFAGGNAFVAGEAIHPPSTEDEEADHAILNCTHSLEPSGVLVVRLSGDIDVTTLSSFSLHLDEALGEGLPFVLDLTEVSFACARSLQILEVTAHRAHEDSVPWAVVGSTAVRRPLAALGIDMVPFYADVTNAVADLATTT